MSATNMQMYDGSSLAITSITNITMSKNIVGFVANNTASSGLTAGRGVQLQQATTAGYIDFSAEL